METGNMGASVVGSEVGVSTSSAAGVPTCELIPQALPTISASSPRPTIPLLDFIAPPYKESQSAAGENPSFAAHQLGNAPAAQCPDGDYDADQGQKTQPCTGRHQQFGREVRAETDSCQRRSHPSKKRQCAQDAARPSGEGDRGAPPPPPPAQPPQQGGGGEGGRQPDRLGYGSDQSHQAVPLPRERRPQLTPAGDRDAVEQLLPRCQPAIVGDDIQGDILAPTK